MGFRETDRKKALAIVRIFETGKAAGDYAVVAVLDDGAGVSYGTNQFTHRSGSLLRVVERYLASGSNAGRAVLTENLGSLRQTSAAAIRGLADNLAFKNALRLAAMTPEMRAAQDAIAEDLYLRPAIAACEEMGFVLPLSLAVVYDSINQGGWERIRSQVPFVRTPLGADLTNERLWITTYIRKRDAWLASVKRLAVTRYRTRFFLNQIAVSNWELRLPVRVQGVSLTDALLKVSAVGPATSTDPNAKADGTDQIPQQPSTIDQPDTDAQPPDHTWSHCLDALEERVNAAAAKYDEVEALIESVIIRKDAAKSLWTTVAGTVSQAVWALFGLAAGVPREIWLVVAIVAGALMLGYLYRQIALGKIREMRSEKVLVANGDRH